MPDEKNLGENKPKLINDVDRRRRDVALRFSTEQLRGSTSPDNTHPRRVYGHATLRPPKLPLFFFLARVRTRVVASIKTNEYHLAVES